MIRTVGIVGKPHRERISAVVPPLLDWLHNRGLHILLDNETAACFGTEQVECLQREELASKADLLIVLGGDGTILAAARSLGQREIPILPVNLGGLGFLTSVTLEEINHLLEQVLAGKYRVSERMKLESEVIRGGKASSCQTALNDAVVTQPALARMMDFELSIDSDHVGRYRADGIIVSTPTGSTAYSLAAGGPIVHPDLDAFVITPICPHMLTNRPLVVPGGARIEIHFPVDETLRLTLDGQVGVELNSGERVAIRKSATRVLLVRPLNKSYFEILRSKLRWGER